MGNSISIKFEGENFEGMARLKDVLKKYSKAYVKVGLFGGNHSSNGESLVKIGALHEFGDKKTRSFMYKGHKIKIKGLPARSWLRTPLRLKKGFLKGRGYEGKEFFKRVLIKEFEHGYTGVALKFVGINAENIIDEAFNTQGYGQWQPNINKEYVSLKGSDTPLIDTGELRRAVTSEVVDGE